MENSNNIHKYAARAGVGVVAVVIMAIVAPIIWAAVSAGLALVALGMVAGVGLAMYKSLPLMGQKLENFLLGKRKSEARQNPIEQLQNYMMQRANLVAQFKNALAQIKAQIKNSEDIIRRRKKEKPNADVTQQEDAVKSMLAAYDILVDKYRAAEDALSELRELVEDRKFQWDFAKAGQLAIDSMNTASGENLLKSMLADEAGSAVLTKFNTVFAELEVESERINSGNSMKLGNSVIDSTAISIPAMNAAGGSA